jgi:MFS transporter, AAHS family, vanillate permease
VNNNNIRQLVAERPLTSFQALAIALCIGPNMLDGFDILAMSFSASGVKAAWNLQNSELGELPRCS